MAGYPPLTESVGVGAVVSNCGVDVLVWILFWSCFDVLIEANFKWDFVVITRGLGGWLAGGDA